MATTSGDRIRLSDESVANIKVATRATIEPVKGGYKVRVENDYGGELLRDGSGDAVYVTKGSAKKVVERHNEDVVFVEKEVLPSPSMRPPAAA